MHTLRFIRRARDFGFSINDITRLLALWRDKECPSADVKQVALQHVTGLRRKIAEMEGMVRALEHLARHCHGDSRPDCPILDDLTGGRRIAPEPHAPAAAEPAREVYSATAPRTALGG